MRNKHQTIEEPCEVKVSRTVLKTSGAGDSLAEFNSMQECIQEQQYTLELFPELREIYFCPDFEGKKCFRVTGHNVYNHSKTKWSGQYRKPRSGMLQLAMVRHKHSPQNSLYVGDRLLMNKLPNEQGCPFNGHGTGSSNINRRSSPTLQKYSN